MSILFYSCSSVQTHPEAHIVEVDSYARNLAAEDDRFDNYFENYLQRGNFFERLKNIKLVAQSLYGVLPEQGDARKRLVGQFIDDVQKQVVVLARMDGSADDPYSYWIPSESLPKFKEKIDRIGKVVQSGRVMEKLGIYLSASKVLNKPSATEDFYLHLIAKALSEIDLQFKDVSVAVYSVEDRETNYREAQFAYAQDLAIKARMNLKRVFSKEQKQIVERIDQLLLKIQSEDSTASVKTMLKSGDWAFTKTNLANLNLQKSTDVDGINDEFERTISTKFGFEMIQYLYENIL